MKSALKNKEDSCEEIQKHPEGFFVPHFGLIFLSVSSLSYRVSTSFRKMFFVFKNHCSQESINSDKL